MAISRKQFIEQSMAYHKGKYDYSLVEDRFYVTRDHIVIICPEHGEFWQTVGNHKSGSGCNECANERRKKQVINGKKNEKMSYRSSITVNQKLIDSIWK